jgi:TonB-dependent siderophore receptor
VRTRQYDFDIPSQRLSRSVSAVTEAAGIQLFYNDDGRGAATAPALKGRMTVDEALTRLTAGTGFTYRYAGPGVVTLERVAAEGERVLGPVRVEGAQGDSAGPPARGEGVAQLGGRRGGQDEEARGYRPVVAAVGAGAPTALEDIPRSITVMTQLQMEKQDIQTMGEALKRLPGVTFIEATHPFGGAEIVSRGFAIQSLQIDGGAPRRSDLSILGNGLLDLSAYERVELVRGSNGAFLGAGSPGGMLNLVRKRPGPEETTRVKATLGRWDRRELELDYSTPSLLGTSLALRTVATLREQQFFYDHADRRSGSLYVMVDAPLGDKARLEGGYRYTASHDNGSYQGFPRYVDGPLLKVPRGFNIVPPWTYNDADTSEWFSKFHVDLMDDWDFSAGATFTTRNHSAIVFSPYVYLYSVTGEPFPGLSGYAPAAKESSVLDSDLFGIDFRLAGGFATGPFNHTLLVTGDLDESTGAGANQSRPVTNLGSYTLNSLADLDPLRYPYPIFTKYSPYQDHNTSTSTMGFTIADTISWRDKIDLNLAVRRYDQEQSGIQASSDPITGALASVDLSEAFSGDIQPKDAWSPSWSLVVKPLKGLSLYGSMSEGATDQSSYYTVAGKPMAPSTYDNIEFGLKYGRAAWLLSLSGYDQQRANVALAIPGTVGRCPPTPTSLCYEDGGATVKSKGVDVELTGQVRDDLSVIASYNWNHEETISTGLRNYTQAPSRMAQVFLDWRPLFAPRLSFDLGAVYRSRVYRAGSAYFIDDAKAVTLVPYAFSEPASLAIDLGADYRLTDSLALRFYIENLTDKDYATTPAPYYDIRAAPRSVMFTLTWTDRGRALSGSGRTPFGDPADWYGGFQVGYHALDDLEGISAGRKADGTRANWNFETQAGPAFNVLLGYRLSTAWRVEVDGAFRRSDFGRIAGEGTVQSGVCGASRAMRGLPFNCDDAQGDADDWSAMANLVHDFGPADWRLRPFVGLGLGLSRSSIDFSGKMKGVGSDDILSYCTAFTADGRCSSASLPGSVWIGGDTQKIALAWQALAGLSFQVTKRLNLDASYRYYSVPDLKWGSWNYPGVLSYNPPNSPFAPRLGDFSGDYKDHAFNLGLRWAFGQR